MVDHEKRLKIIKGYLTHIVAMGLIGVFVVMLVISAFNKEITVPAILISLGSGAVGFYLRDINTRSTE